MTKPPPETLAEYIDQVLTRSGLELTEIAKRAEVSQPYISQLRQGKKTKPSRHILQAIGAAVGLGQEEIEKLLSLAGYAPLAGGPEPVGRFRPLLAGGRLPASEPEPGWQRVHFWRRAHQQAQGRAEVQTISPTKMEIRFYLEPFEPGGPAPSPCRLRWNIDGRELQDFELKPNSHLPLVLEPGRNEFVWVLGGPGDETGFEIWCPRPQADEPKEV